MDPSGSRIPQDRLSRRQVISLERDAYQQAQKKDTSATRAYTATEIRTNTGKCLFVDELSGDFRANLTPIQLKTCDGSSGQKWDVITAGRHLDPIRSGLALVVNSLTLSCMNYDPRTENNTFFMFSCGGRADGSGDLTESQMFKYSGGIGPFTLEPILPSGNRMCITSNANDTVAFATLCDARPKQQFTLGGSGAEPSPLFPLVESATPSGTPVPTETNQTGSAPPKNNMATIVGAVVGVLAATLLILGFFLLRRRRKNRTKKRSTLLEPYTPPEQVRRHPTLPMMEHFARPHSGSFEEDPSTVLSLGSSSRKEFELPLSSLSDTESSYTRSTTLGGGVLGLQDARERRITYLQHQIDSAQREVQNLQRGINPEVPSSSWEGSLRGAGSVFSGAESAAVQQVEELRSQMLGMQQQINALRDGSAEPPPVYSPALDVGRLS